MRALWRASIWARDSIPRSERKYAAPLKRVVFPVFDVVVVLLGIGGLGTGFQALRLTFPDPVPTVLYGTLVLCGVVCFFGCAFPRLWVAEIAGKMAILTTLGVLLIAMLIAGTTVPGHTGLVIAPMVFGMMLVPFLRLWVLGVEWGDRGIS
ncbi:MAG: 21, gp21 [Microbacterium sp.]|jgi:hypothetical protein|nr:21, gp21 [Microbacterium sp.]